MVQIIASNMAWYCWAVDYMLGNVDVIDYDGQPVVRIHKAELYELYACARGHAEC
jgi:hypothetical protein